MFRTPKRTKQFTTTSELVQVTPPNKLLNGKKVLDSVEKSSPAVASPNSTSTLSPSETRRGRPRAEVLNTLILQGSSSPSSIKCTFCNRVFPREKSLQAHLRTHTGERPYVCDYPKCNRRFAQSGQLKTHQRLHTGEKPFICSAPNCEKKFTHANRHCPEHPEFQLKRFNSSPSFNFEKVNDEEHSYAVQKWLDGLKKRDNDKYSIETTPKKQSRCNSEPYEEQNENIYTNSNVKTKSLAKNFECSTATSANPSPTIDNYAEENQHFYEEYSSAQAMLKLHEGTFTGQQLFPKDEGSAASCGPNVNQSNAVPKKRWLREAVLEQQKWDSNQDLARPINWGDDVNLIEYENQRRPTVLVRMEQGEKKEISKSDMQIAMALVELRNANTPAKRELYQF